MTPEADAYTTDASVLTLYGEAYSIGDYRESPALNDSQRAAKKSYHGLIKP